MAQKIESDKLLVKEVFSKWFRIPEYQRPYVWDNDQVTELLDDVMHARNANPDSQYFLGSMVLQKKEKKLGTTHYEEFDLLDGQQRLTTLLLITAVIRDLSTDNMLIDTCNTTIYQSENIYDNIPERLRIVFDIRDEVRDFINLYVKEKGGTDRETDLEYMAKNTEEIVSIRNMAKAILNIRNYFSKNHIGQFFTYLRSNVLMIYVATEDLEDAFRLFTIMNSRGVKLRNSDILKSINLGSIPNKDIDKRIEWAKKWEVTENYFGENFDNFLSHLRTILVKQKATVSLLKEFETNIYDPSIFDPKTKTYVKIKPLLDKGEKTFAFVEKYFKHYDKLFDQDNYDLSNSFELFNYLQLMQKGFEADLWMAPLLHYFEKFSFNRLIDFVKKLDNKFAADWLLGYSPTERIENINAIIQAIDDAVKIEDIHSGTTLTFNGVNLLNVLDGNIYGRHSARYIMLKLDLMYHGHTQKFDMPETISIEHILPQTPPENSKWRADFTDEERLNWTHKLGNLTLISRRKNSSQGNKDFTEKKEKYFKNNIETFSNSVRVYQNFPTWNLNDLTKNHTEVIAKIKHGFGI